MYNITETKNMRPVYVRKTIKSTPFKNIPDNMFGLSSDEFGRNNFLKPNPIDAEPTDTETFKALDIEKHGLKVQLGAKTIRSILGGDTNTTLDGIKKEIEKTIVSGGQVSTKQRNDIIVQLSTILGKHDVTIKQLETIKMLALRAGAEVKYDEMGLPRIMTAQEYKSMAGVVLFVLVLGIKTDDIEAINYPVVVLDRDGNETKRKVRTSQIYNNLTASGRGLEKYLDMELKAIVPRNLALLTLDDNKEINKGGFLNGVPKPMGGWLQYDDDNRTPPWVRVRDDIPPLPIYERFKMDRQATEATLKNLEREVKMENKMTEQKRFEEKKREEEVLDLERRANAELLNIDTSLDKLSQDLNSNKITGKEYVKQTIFLIKTVGDAVKLYDNLIYNTTYNTLLITLDNIKNTTPAIKNEMNIVRKEIKNRLNIPTPPSAPTPPPATVVQPPAIPSVPPPTQPPATVVQPPATVVQPSTPPSSPSPPSSPVSNIPRKVLLVRKAINIATLPSEQKANIQPNGIFKKEYYDELLSLAKEYIDRMKEVKEFKPQQSDLVPLTDIYAMLNTNEYLLYAEDGKKNTQKTINARKKRVKEIFNEIEKIGKRIAKNKP